MGIVARVKRTLGIGGNDAEIAEELRFHLDMDMADGHDERAARLRLGHAALIAEDTRAMGVVAWLESVIEDVRFGLRQLRKHPVVMAAIVLSLAIGIGANTAIFGLVDAALLRPLPVTDPDSLRIVEWTHHELPKGVSNVNGDFTRVNSDLVRASSISAGLYRALARQQTSFEPLMGVADPNSLAVAVGSLPAEQVGLQYVSANFFQGLGLAPAAGRAFTAADDRLAQEPVVIVSHRFWRSRLGADRDLSSKIVRINNAPVRVVGVAPPRFFGLQPGQWTDVYTPLAARVAFGQIGSGATTARGEDDSDWWVRMIGRVTPGSSPEAATAGLAAVFRTMAVPQLVSKPGRRGFGGLNPRDETALRMLLWLVGLLLLIVCVNIANLLLSRSVARQRESALRLALGAGRLRIFRQHLIESALLALLGGAGGLVLGYVLAQSIHVMFQTGRSASSAFDLQIDLRLMAFASAAAVAAALLFGVLPAIRAARSEVGDALKAQTRTIANGGLRVPRAFVSIQMALCLTALVAAGLLGRSLENLETSEIGFDRSHLAYATVNPWQSGYDAQRVGQYVARAREAIAAIPGVSGVGPIQVRLLSGNGNFMRARFPGRPAGAEDGFTMNSVGEGLFDILGIPIVSGRALDRSDQTPQTSAVVVDERFALRYFPHENAVGRRFGTSEKDSARFEIVGVVRDSRYSSLRADPQPGVYFPFVPATNRGQVHFAIRASIGAAALAESVRQAAASVDPAVPVTEFHTQTELIDRLLRTERLLGFLFAAFGIVALAVAAIGLGALLAYAVARRTNEIGVRMALGAARRDVVGLVLGDSLGMVAAGVLLGVPAAFLTARMLKTLLFGLDPFDPSTAAVSVAALVATALVAAWIPARRAASIDPMTALREE